MAGVLLAAEDGSMSVTIPFAADPPRSQGGGPALARIPRPRKKPITEWTNRNELQLAVSFMLDNFVSGDGVTIERKIRLLEKMQGRDQGDPEPHPLIVLGDPPGSIPNDYHDAAHLRWWLEEIQPDDSKTLLNDHGNRVRYTGVLIFTEVVEDEPLGNLKAASHKKKGASAKKYRVKKGDTLSKIAAKYKIKGGWHALAKMNGIRDPKRLKVGQEIRLK